MMIILARGRASLKQMFGLSLNVEPILQLNCRLRLSLDLIQEATNKSLCDFTDFVGVKRFLIEMLEVKWRPT